MKHLQSISYKNACIHKEQVQQVLSLQGDKAISEVTLNHVFTGLRGLPLRYTPTSQVDAQKGVLYRGRTLKDIRALLPKFDNQTEPPSEALFWYLLSSEVPDKTIIEDFRHFLHMRAHVPYHVFLAMDNLPKLSRPMTRFCAGILAWATESSFQHHYNKGISKEDYWKYTYYDALNLIAGLPQVVAYIYRVHCKYEDYIAPDPDLDWVGNLAHMMGYDSPDVAEMLRMFMFTHADHGPSNVSAHTAHLVGSALANMYHTYAASMLGLSGPLHGYANVQVVQWLSQLLHSGYTTNGTNTVSDTEFIIKYVEQYLDNKRVIPGYGHAALRVTDPRFTLFQELIQRNNITSPMLQLVMQIHKIVPDILKKRGRAKNPNPNIDAITGACLHAVGIKEYDFYTVLFGTARVLGVAAQNIIDRIFALPIERPSSVKADVFKEYLH